MKKMKKSLLKKKVSTLSKLDTLKKGNDMSFLREYPDEKIHDICEACYNILQENIPIKGNKKYQLKKKLKPIKNEIRKLANSKISVKTKRKLLAIPQVGRGIVSAIATVVLPALISMLSRK